MKFSVIIPLYNKAPYVRKALESVFAQTYTDYELIIVDDGSTDGSFTIAKQFIDERLEVKGTEDEVKGYRLKVKGTEDEVKGYRLKVKGKENSGTETNGAETNGYKLSPINYKLIRQANSGVSAARNAGVAQAQGEYLAFLDADDWWEPTYLERMAQLIEDYPNAGLYASNYVYYKPGKTHVALKNIETGYFNYPKAYYESGAMPIWTGAAIIPRKVYDEMGGFRNHLWMAEDFDLWIRVALSYKVAFLNEPLAYYNQVVQLKWRALGKLYPPIRQFAFDADYLIPYQNENIDIKHVVDMVKIVCLKQYYISREYHQLSKKELEKIDCNEYRDKSFASYLWQPLWKLRLILFLEHIYKTLKNK